MGSLVIPIDQNADQSELIAYLRSKGLKPQIIDDDLIEDLALANAIEDGETNDTVDTESFIDSLIDGAKDWQAVQKGHFQS